MGIVSGVIVRKYLFITVFLFLLSGTLPCLAADVMLLHSDSQGSYRGNHVRQGVLQTLQTKDNSLHVVEFWLEADKNTSEEHFDDVAEKLAQRLKQHPVQGVICVGEAALAMLQRYRSHVFGTIPATFCCVENFEPRMARDGHCTGITSKPGLERLFDIVLALHPKARTVAVFTDQTPESSELRRQAQIAFERHMDRIQLVLPGFEAGREGGLTKKQALQIAQGMPKNGLILMARFVRDNTDAYVQQDDLTRKMAESATVPVYVLREEDMAAATAGGFMVNEMKHGQQAAQQLLKLMAGASLSSQPVARLPRYWQFNALPMQRATTDFAQVPKNAEVTGLPKQAQWFPLPPGLAALGGIALGALVVFLLRRKSKGKNRSS